MARVCDELGEGQVVHIDLDPERSKRAHNHQFAFVHTAWMNLPETLIELPYAMNADTLRKHALIATGHCNTAIAPCGTPAQAEHTRAAILAIATDMNGYAIAEVRGRLVYCHTPHSQKLKSMGKEKFQRSKQDILVWLADLIGVTPEQLAVMGKKEPHV